MELLILRNGNIFARATAEGGTMNEYSFVAVDNLPAYPTESPGKGKKWELTYDKGICSWVLADRPFTAEERLEVIENEVNEIKLGWKAGESVVVGDRRYYNNSWYVCVQPHITQTDWHPDITPALWNLEV